MGDVGIGIARTLITPAGDSIIDESSDALQVKLVDSGVHVDDDGFTLGTDSGVMMMGFAGTQSVGADDAAALACETNGSLHIHDGGNSITVDGTVGITGTYILGTNTYLESTTKAIPTAAVRNDTLATLVNTENELAPLQVNAEGALYVKIDGGVDHNITGMVSGKNTGVDDTTAEVIVAAASCKRIDMMASPSNTGDIWVGGSNVAIGQGIKLAPGDFYSIDIDSTGDVYVKATVDEEDIHYTYYT
jgi:hypothetical protein